MQQRDELGSPHFGCSAVILDLFSSITYLPRLYVLAPIMCACPLLSRNIFNDTLALATSQVGFISKNDYERSSQNLLN